MYRNERFRGTFALLAASVLLSGCTSLLQGKQYAFPLPDEPSAIVRLESGQGSRLDAMTFNDSGCYAGYTSLSANDGFIQAPVAAGKELILTYWQVVGSSACKIPFSFTPQAGATYTLKSGFWSEPKAGILPIFNRDQYYCGLGVVKKVGNQESVEPVKPLEIKTGFACLRFVEKKP